MARYIDLDEATAHLRNKCYAKYPLSYTNGIAASINELRKMPTADVVPKSEVDFLRKTITENAQKALEVTLEEVEKAKADGAREIFSEIDLLFERFYDDPSYSSGDLGYDIAELKKKYTED